MTEFLDFNLNESYAEIKERAQTMPVTSKEAWDDLVEEFVNEKINIGELDKDEDSQGIIENLKAMWPEYEKNLRIR
jgi:hypothetical protein